MEEKHVVRVAVEKVVSDHSLTVLDNDLVPDVKDRFGTFGTYECDFTASPDGRPLYVDMFYQFDDGNVIPITRLYSRVGREWLALKELEGELLSV